jgi:hypothetical protein
MDKCLTGENAHGEAVAKSQSVPINGSSFNATPDPRPREPRNRFDTMTKPRQIGNMRDF